MLKTYEALFIFDQSLDDEAVGKALERVQGEIERLNGKVVDTQMMGKRTFARPMKKREMGHYVRLLVELDPQSIVPLHARFKLNEDVFRAQIVLRGEGKAQPEETDEGSEVRTDGES